MRSPTHAPTCAWPRSLRLRDQLAPGEPLPSIRELLAKHGHSRQTVARPCESWRKRA